MPGRRPRLVAVSHGAPLKRTERVGPAEIAYLTGGDPASPPVVFVHGFPTHSHLWRHVVDLLDDDVWSLAPDLLGLGDTVVSPYEDLSAPMQAEILLEWLDRLGVDRFALVAHAQGGAVAHQIVANVPQRISHLALIDVVAYDNWPAPYWADVAKVPGTGVLDAVARATGVIHRLHDLRVGLAGVVYDRSALGAEVLDEYLRPLRSPAGREAARRFLLAGRPTFTLECVGALQRLRVPSLVVWGADDPVLSPSWGVRLVADLPTARSLELVPFCGHLLPEERPGELAGLLRSLLARSS